MRKATWFPRIIDGSLLYLLLYGISIAQTNSLVEMKQYNDGPVSGFPFGTPCRIYCQVWRIKVITFSEGSIMEIFVSCAALVVDHFFPCCIFPAETC